MRFVFLMVFTFVSHCSAIAVDLPDDAKPLPELKLETGVAYSLGSSVIIELKEVPENGKLNLPRMANVVEKVRWLGDTSDAVMKLGSEITVWTVDLSEPPAGETRYLELVLDAVPLTFHGKVIAESDKHGVFVLPAKFATTFGEKLRFEPQPHKDTIGYWVNEKDYAEWHIKNASSGVYDVEIFQGCGKGQGGSDIELQVADQKTALTVLDTGHFQNFKWRKMGQIEIPAGDDVTVRLAAIRKAKNAVMDCREIRLIPAKNNDPSLRQASSNEAYQENPGTAGNGNFTIGPEYTIDPDLTDRGNPKGKYFEFSMPLADSKIFRGDDSTLDRRKDIRKERKIFVYVPAAYKDGTKAPILVIHDGPGQMNLVRNALDNLTISKDADRKLPALIAIAVQNGGNDSKGSQRGLEYDTMSDRLARFINDEVLPAVLNNSEIKAAYPKIAFTDNPWGKAAMGCSSGGAAALTMGWFRPDLFRRLITYSGTFVDQQDDDAAEEAAYPLGAWEYHSSMKLIENSEKKSLRIFTHVSEFDNRAKDPEETYHNWVMANERTADALKAKGYDYRYVYSKATRHCDGKVFQQTLADTLVWMWQGYHEE